MHSETWHDLATRLHKELVPRGHGAREEDEEDAARARMKIALWLRREFGASGEHVAANVLRFERDE